MHFRICGKRSSVTGQALGRFLFVVLHPKSLSPVLSESPLVRARKGNARISFSLLDQVQPLGSSAH